MAKRGVKAEVDVVDEVDGSTDAEEIAIPDKSTRGQAASATPPGNDEVIADADGNDILNGCQVGEVLGWFEPMLEKMCYVRVVNGNDRDQIEVQRFSTKGTGIRGLVACKCLCKANGQRLYNDGQVGSLSLLNGKFLTRVFEHADKLNNFTGEYNDETEKNSESVPSASSGS